MKILFIWFGVFQPMYAWRHKCVMRTKELYPDAEFTAITNLRTFYGMRVINANEVVEEMKGLGLYHNIRDHMRMSDEMRFWWLSNHQDTLYLDTDTWCKEPMPYSKEPGKMRIEALWSGKDTSEFKRILDKRNYRALYIKYAKELKMRELHEYFEHTPTNDRTKEIEYGC